MKREIKFRGRVEDKKFVYGYLFGICIIHNLEDKALYICDKDTVGQYTGMKDKNGKEIYEGDIVRSDKKPFSTPRAKDNIYAVVEWLESCTMFALSFYFNPNGEKRGGWVGTKNILGYFDELEVIGNIYDNPELLKE